jgi:hypothetical protein
VKSVLSKKEDFMTQVTIPVSDTIFCEMNIYDFISTASRAGIPIIDYSIEEADRELAQLYDNR